MLDFTIFMTYKKIAYISNSDNEMQVIKSLFQNNYTFQKIPQKKSDCPDNIANIIIINSQDNTGMQNNDLLFSNLALKYNMKHPTKPTILILNDLNDFKTNNSTLYKQISNKEGLFIYDKDDLDGILETAETYKYEDKRLSEKTNYKKNMPDMLIGKARGDL